jgi:hypothetical protein
LKKRKQKTETKTKKGPDQARLSKKQPGEAAPSQGSE